jgi:hypothetical protein
VFDDTRGWNEQYLLQALLMFSSHFRVVFSCYYASRFMAPQLQAAGVDDRKIEYGGGSLWIEKIR